MPAAKKTTKKTTKKETKTIAAKVTPAKKNSSKRPAKETASKKREVTSKRSSQSPALNFSSFGSNISRTKDRFVTSLKKNSKTRWILAGVIVIALILLAVPHLVVATVDGKPITIFSYYGTLDQKYGADTKQQLISEQLIEDEAQKRGVTVSDQEVNSQLKQLEDQASGSANLDQILQQQGLTRDEFTKQVRLQAMIKKMFSSEASVSSKDIDQYIAQNKDQLPDPVDDQTRASIKDQLQQQKLVSAFQDWLSQASSSNRVVKF